MLFKKKSYISNRIDENIKNSLEALFRVFKANNKELFLVGGCVRDLLLNKQPKDYDLCTNATPDEVKEMLSKIEVPHPKDENLYYAYLVYEAYHIIDTGIKHGTVTIHDLGFNQFYEITTYRIDGKYSDGRHPDEIIFTSSLEEDLKRRDFTINSFAYDLLNNDLVMLKEYFLTDLEQGIIRTVGKACNRFSEDALRMLRAIRFAAQLDFTIESDTYNTVCIGCADLIKYISKERIRDELTKILLSNNPRYLELIATTGLEQYIFNGRCPISDMINCSHDNPYHYTDVYHHTLDVIERVPKTFELRWSAFFHDIGKPFTKEFNQKKNYYSYLEHAKKSEEIALEIMQLLKFSNQQIDIISTFVRLHDKDLAICKMSTFRKYLDEIGVDRFLDYMKLREADASAHCLTKSTIHFIDDITKCYERYREVIENPKTALRVVDLDIDGYDLMKLGLQGKRIGDCLNMLLERVLENPNDNDKEKLLIYAKEFAKLNV